jgi:Uncharacterized protein conserved in bacteria
MTEKIKAEARTAALRLCEAAKLEKGAVVIIGCSSSEVTGQRMGTQSSPEIGTAVFEGLYEVFCEKVFF